MNIRFNKVVVEVPHRISGFFEIVDKSNGVKIQNPMKIGSRGAGFNLSAVGMTTIDVKEDSNSEGISCKIFINEEELNQNAETSYYIFDYLKKYIKKPVNIEVFHSFDLPVGCGYGASGSGALGMVLGLNYALNLKLNSKKLGSIAHIAEVINKTGLGTVCGQLTGGLCILKEPGFPCVVQNIETPKDISIICASFGTIYTKSILSDSILSLKIKEAGKIALSKLLKKPNINTFIKVSIEFVESTEILKILELSEIEELIVNLNKLNILGASMNQLGRSVYAICKRKDVERVFEVFNSFNSKVKLYMLSINKNGPKIFKKK